MWILAAKTNVSRSIDVSVRGMPTETTDETFACPVGFMCIVTFRAFLRSVGGIDLHNFNPVAFRHLPHSPAHFRPSRTGDDAVQFPAKFCTAKIEGFNDERANVLVGQGIEDLTEFVFHRRDDAMLETAETRGLVGFHALSLQTRL